MSKMQTTPDIETISPIDGQLLFTRTYASPTQIALALQSARRARSVWSSLTIRERSVFLSTAIAWLVERTSEVAEEITRQIGRPIIQSPGELRGIAARVQYMTDVAEPSLADINPTPMAGLRRYLRRQPLGTVLVIAPWNYPLLTAINTIAPALLAGNTVILKHAAQTMLTAERLQQAFDAAGLPAGVFQNLCLSHPDVAAVVADETIDFVAFTGSVSAGRIVQTAASQRFIGVGLELGGKDPAYVRADADLPHAVDTVIDGALFNSGQSCCGIERAYVHASCYDDFVARAVTLVRQYRLGNPLDQSTTLGPMVKASAAAFVQQQIDEAIEQGAEALIDPAPFGAYSLGAAYLAPQLLIGVDHRMRVMSEETFGPLLSIMA
ncbi:aldehyde dehydrogenase family protein, partial [Steroidobacter sp.]|uniref:aldehyde dehydrogenase family protein n=1 Tax=Steroidobacter sp. TaxID=1978227 RepID=UPI001A637892